MSSKSRQPGLSRVTPQDCQLKINHQFRPKYRESIAQAWSTCLHLSQNSDYPEIHGHDHSITRHAKLERC
ncbi:hypothetical protein CBS147311_6447 [Penicillium roqueforti]|nr:hypothetical protein CBS147311_6447 [Penicillium roqueforti]